MLLPSLVRTFVTAAALAVAAACFAQGDSAGQAKAGITDSRALRLSELKNSALQYFEGKKWAEAIKKFEEHLAMLTEPEKGQLVAQVVYLGLAECNFNLEKEEFYLKAIAYWQEFLRRWGQDEKVIQVKSAIAQANMRMKKWESAVEWWVQVESMARDPKFLDTREYSLTGQAVCFKQLKKPEDEISVLERMVYPDFNTEVSAEGAVRLMSLYALKHDPAVAATIEFADKAVALLKKLQTKIHLVENFIALNSVAIKLGDELLDVHAYPKALEAYWTVRSRDTVAAMQRDRIALIERRMAQNIANAGKDPTKNVAARAENEYIKPRLDEAKRI